MIDLSFVCKLVSIVTCFSCLIETDRECWGDNFLIYFSALGSFLRSPFGVYKTWLPHLLCLKTWANPPGTSLTKDMVRPVLFPYPFPPSLPPSFPPSFPPSLLPSFLPSFPLSFPSLLPSLPPSLLPSFLPSLLPLPPFYDNLLCSFRLPKGQVEFEDEDRIWSCE